MADEDTSDLAVREETALVRRVEETSPEKIGEHEEEQILIGRGLPKWPQLIILGTPVTPAQAEEIVRRCDSFFRGYGGNDHDFDNDLRRRFRMSPDRWSTPEKPFREDEFRIRMEYNQRWEEAWGYLRTQYVMTSWISSCYIGGPHGFVHPTGEIGAFHNVGKWPSCEDIRDDLTLIAGAFPFLDIGAVLNDIIYDQNGEELGDRYVVGFRIRDGKIKVCDPERVNVLEGFAVPHVPTFEEMLAKRNFRDYDYEHGAPPEWYDRWEARAAELFDADYRIAWPDDTPTRRRR